MKNTLITSYINPDLDGAACIIGYAEFLSKQQVDVDTGVFGDLQIEVKYVLDRFNIPYPQSLSNGNSYENIILVDTSSPEWTGGVINPLSVIEIIDHRKVNE